MPLFESMSQSLLNHVFGGTDFSRPATLHLGLSTTAITGAGGNITEPSGAAGYARVPITNNATNFPASTVVGGKAIKRNGTVITFPEATGSWGTVTHWFLSSAATGGTLIAYGALGTSRSVVALDIPRFSANDLEIRVAPVS